MAADLELLDEIYRFCMARAKERANGTIPGQDLHSRRNSQALLSIYAGMRRNIVDRPSHGVEGIDYFRKQAMTWKDHPDFDPIWTIEAT